MWAPGVRGAVVVSLRGGDFLFESGQDLSIGYDHHDADLVHLYLEESFTLPRRHARGGLLPQAGRLRRPGLRRDAGGRRADRVRGAPSAGSLPHCNPR